MRGKIDTQELLARCKNSALNIAVILAALFISFKAYSGTEKEVVLLRRQKEDEAKKSKVLKNIERMSGELASYKQLLNKKDVLENVAKLNDIAKRSSVNIISLLPLSAKEAADYILYPFNLTILAQDYHILARFINELEKDADVYWVNSLSVLPQPSGSGKTRQPAMRAEMQIVTILYKD